MFFEHLLQFVISLFTFFWFLNRSLGGHSSSECLEILPGLGHGRCGVCNPCMCEVQLEHAAFTHAQSVRHLPMPGLLLCHYS